MNTSLLADCRAQLRGMAELMELASDALNTAENAAPGQAHREATYQLHAVTTQLRTRAHALATYAGAAAAVR